MATTRKKLSLPRKVLPRNSYRGRIIGTQAAYESGRCEDLTPIERRQVVKVYDEIAKLLALMEANR